MLNACALSRTSDCPVSSRNGFNILPNGQNDASVGSRNSVLQSGTAPISEKGETHVLDDLLVAVRPSVPPIVTRREAAAAAAAAVVDGGAFSLSLRMGIGRDVTTCVTEREKNLSIRCSEKEYTRETVSGKIRGPSGWIAGRWKEYAPLPAPSPARQGCQTRHCQSERQSLETPSCTLRQSPARRLA